MVSSARDRAVRRGDDRLSTVGSWMARPMLQTALVATRVEPSTTTGEARRIAGSCAQLLSTDGPLAALRFLNARTRFRFTGLYRPEPPLLRNVHLYDRENPTLNVSGDVCRLDDTYCAIVCGGDRPFSTDDAPLDARLVSHASRDSIRSYCGVPIRHDSGCVLGTLCHFDVRPRLVSRSEIEVLTIVAACFAGPCAGSLPSV
jgi:GAF domain-containing protein